jgi:hypothetical protein
MRRATPVSVVIMTHEEALAAFERETSQIDAIKREEARAAFDAAAAEAEIAQAARQAAYDRDTL